MKRHLWICLLLILSVMLTACLKQTATEENVELNMGYTEQPPSEESSPSVEERDNLLQESEATAENSSSPNPWDADTANPDEGTPPPGMDDPIEETVNAESLPPSEESFSKGSQEKTLVLSVNGNDLDVTWEDNETVDELIAYVQNENIVVHTTLYGGFEQVGSLPQAFSKNDVQTTTEPGDIVLYSGNQIVLFFGSNSWSYTMLGHIEGLSEKDLSKLLGESSAVIELKRN